MDTSRRNNNTISFHKEHSDTSSFTGSSTSSSIMEDTPPDSTREPITTAPDDLHDCNKNKILTGVIVNGFHPQLHGWKERNHCNNNSHSINYTMTRNNNGSNSKSHSLKRCRSNASLDEKIKERVSRARIDTVQDLNGIQTAIEHDHLPFVVEASTATGGRNADAVPSMIPRYDDNDEHSIQKMYSDLFEHSDVPQMITAPGGRIAAGNQKILEILGVDKSLQSLTAFDIVTPTMIPKLYEIFLLALQPDAIPNINHHNEESSDMNDVEYPSLTVPCTKIGNGDLSYYITFSLMYDKDPEKRCFHCMLSTTHKMPIGHIYSVSQKYLLEML